MRNACGSQRSWIMSCCWSGTAPTRLATTGELEHEGQCQRRGLCASGGALLTYLCLRFALCHRLIKNSWSTHWGDGGYVKVGLPCEAVPRFHTLPKRLVQRSAP